MESVVLLAGLAFAINKITSVIKAVTNGESRTVITQVIVWAVGFGMLLLTANSDIGGALLIPGFEQPLGEIDVISVLLLGIILGSSGSFVYDFKKAIDNTDNASETPLKLGSG